MVCISILNIINPMMPRKTKLYCFIGLPLAAILIWTFLLRPIAESTQSVWLGNIGKYVRIVDYCDSQIVVFGDSRDDLFLCDDSDYVVLHSPGNGRRFSLFPSGIEKDLFIVHDKDGLVFSVHQTTLRMIPDTSVSAFRHQPSPCSITITPSFFMDRCWYPHCVVIQDQENRSVIEWKPSRFWDIQSWRRGLSSIRNYINERRYLSREIY